MKKTKILLFMLIMLSLIFLSCSKDSTGPGNAKPGIPSNPNPEDNATSVSINTNLSWSCSDPDGDPLTYDVCLGTSSQPPLVNSGQSSTTYDPSTLIEETTYYWKIKAHDDHSNSTTGDIWEFTTSDGGGGDSVWCEVPAGDYTYGDPPVTQNISYAFLIMKYEVTNQQYVDYLEEALSQGEITVYTFSVVGYYPGDEHWSSGSYEFLDLDGSYCRIEWTGSEFIIDSDYEDHPVVEVTWFGAWTFAEHYGFELPTEQEWEKAARGNTGYDYPWGDNIDGSMANYYDSGDPFNNGTTPIGYYNGQNYNGFQTTDSPSETYGVYDMAGNVSEWCDSFYIIYPSRRIKRGGNLDSDVTHLQSWWCSYNVPTFSWRSIGFRCVRP